MQRTTVWSWLIGGLLLLVQSVMAVLASFAVRAGDPASVPIELGAALLVAGACAIYAVGARPEESVVARRPAGMAVLFVLGAFVVAHAVWWAGPTGYAAGAGAGPTAALGDVVSFVLAVGGAVAILRVGVIPRPWSWIPLAALLLGLLLAVVFAAVSVVAPGAGGPVGVLPATIPGVVGLVSMVLAVTTHPASPLVPAAPTGAAVRQG
ncbi:hypothetical protein ACIGEP_00390 [Microbacterium sp. NPDC077663]|uniref:hypothetical protein n=1 Tax=Microbacterium sp. NPDC077663 TaxID=3364189 RepID=UPI0037C7640D